MELLRSINFRITSRISGLAANPTRWEVGPSAMTGEKSRFNERQHHRKQSVTGLQFISRQHRPTQRMAYLVLDQINVL